MHSKSRDFEPRVMMEVSRLRAQRERRLRLRIAIQLLQREGVRQNADLINVQTLALIPLQTMLLTIRVHVI